MHTMNMTRDGKAMRRMWRFQSNNFIARAGKDFAAKVLETIYYNKFKKRRHTVEMR
ncbi:MAG: hypothetical protein HQL16_05145 [Candidatus Omnitrophica bacterium]|nr:hypothetical protein [Candidatus Omnitrophota bacterium]